MSQQYPNTPPALAALALVAISTLAGTPAFAQADHGRMVDAFEGAFGQHAGFRRSGAKGVCAVGDFVGNAEGRALSVATAFSGQPVPVVARFSVGGGNPRAADNAKGVRGLALAFALPGGESWQMANINTPVFSAATPEQMLGLLESRRIDPATKMPDPARVKAFNDANPEVLLQPRYVASQPVPASYARQNYWGVNAFAFVDARGNRQFAKWVFEPAEGAAGLADELRQRVAAQPAVFKLVLQLAQPGDRVDSAVVPLPEDRRKVTVGQLTIRSVEAGNGGACANMTFNPTLLPKGVEASADPVLLGRAAPYAASLGRRLQGQ